MAYVLLEYYREVNIMNYKEEIIKLLERVENEVFLRYIYKLLKEMIAK